MKVLLIDDNESITKMLAKYLTRKGHDATACNSGRNGLSLMKEQKFDTIFLDLSMPEFSGLDVIDALEKDDKLKDQNIYIFTASVASDEELNKLIEKGVRGTLRKPVDLDVFLKTVES